MGRGPLYFPPMDLVWKSWLGLAAAAAVVLILRSLKPGRLGSWQRVRPSLYRMSSTNILLGSLLVTLPAAVWSGGFIRGFFWVPFLLITAGPSVFFGLHATLNGFRMEIDLERRELRMRTGLRWGGLFGARDKPRSYPLDGCRLALSLSTHRESRSRAPMEFLYVWLITPGEEPIQIGLYQVFCLGGRRPWRRIPGEVRAHRLLDRASALFGIPAEDRTVFPRRGGPAPGPDQGSGVKVERCGDETWIWLGPALRRRGRAVLAGAALGLCALAVGLSARSAAASPRGSAGWTTSTAAAGASAVLAVPAGVVLVGALRRVRPVAVVRPRQSIGFGWVGPSDRPRLAVQCRAPLLELDVKAALETPPEEPGCRTEVVVRDGGACVRLLPDASPGVQAWLVDALARSLNA